MSTDQPQEDFAAMLAEFEQAEGIQRQKFGIGDMVTGNVSAIRGDSVFIELGGKSEGVLDAAQVLNSDGELTVKVGDEVSARIVDTGEQSGMIVLRRQVGRGPDAGEELLQAFEHRIPVEGLVSGKNKGGFDVQVAGVRAFCPISQMDNHFVENPDDFVGKRFTFRITKCETGRRPNIVLSRRALLEESRQEQAQETRAQLAVGSVVTGTVISLKSYGAFVDIGGLEGMLHVSELGHSRVSDPSEVLQVGQAVEVMITKIETTEDAKRPERIGLSLKALQTDPWDASASQFQVGQTVRGPVVRIQPFGAFVELAPGVEGLVHISEMGEGKRINTPRDVVKIGEAVDVAIVSVDSERHRIGLSMDSLTRAAEAAEQQEAIASHKPSPKSLGTLADLFKK